MGGVSGWKNGNNFHRDENVRFCPQGGHAKKLNEHKDRTGAVPRPRDSPANPVRRRRDPALQKLPFFQFCFKRPQLFGQQ